MAKQVTNTILAGKLDLLTNKVDKVEKLLTGNGEPERGMIVRLDRLETSESKRQRRGWMVYTATIGALITAVVSLVMQ